MYIRRDSDCSGQTASCFGSYLTPSGPCSDVQKLLKALHIESHPEAVASNSLQQCHTSVVGSAVASHTKAYGWTTNVPPKRSSGPYSVVVRQLGGLGGNYRASPSSLASPSQRMASLSCNSPGRETSNLEI